MFMFHILCFDNILNAYRSNPFRPRDEIRNAFHYRPAVDINYYFFIVMTILIVVKLRS